MSRFIQSFVNRDGVDVALKCWCSSEQCGHSWTMLMQMSAAWCCRCLLLGETGAGLQLLLFRGAGTAAG